MPSFTVTVGTRDYTVDAPDPRTAWDWAHRYAAENPAPAPKTGMIDSAIASVKGALSRGQTGIESLLSDPNAATERGMRRGRRLDDEYQSQVSLDEIKRRYNEDGILSAAGEVARQFPYALAEQAPRIAATAAAARTGAMLGGAAAGPVGALVGGIGGAAVPSAVEFFGGNLERQGETQKKAGQAVNVDRGDAALAAIPQAGMDAVATLLPLGRTYVGKLLGPAAEEFLKRGGSKVADEALWKVVTKGGAVSLGTEVPTEIVQQILERKQAGLPLTDDAAMAEYGQAAYGAALLSPIGAYGRYNDRSEARDQRTAAARTKALADRKAAEAKAALEAGEAQKRRFAEQTGAPLLAGALPEGDEAVVTGPNLPVVNQRDEEAAALLGEIESPEIARQYRLMRGQRDTLNEQMMAAAAAGDVDTANKIRPQLAQLAQGVKNAEQRAAEQGINLAQFDTALAQERVAAIEAEEKSLLRQLKKAGEGNGKGDTSEKVGTLLDKITALQKEKATLQQPSAAPGATTFTTAKGSQYVVNEDGTTTRNKAYRPEHGVSEQGPMPQSQTTFYVDEAGLQALGEFQAQGSGKKSLVRLPDGRYGMQYQEGPNAGKIEGRTVTGVSDTPQEGMYPVELWKDGSVVHFGNKITAVSKQQGGQMGLFGEENLDRIEADEQTQQQRMAEAEATVRQPAPGLTREAEGNRDISEITANIATQPNDIRTLRTLNMLDPQQRAEYEEAIDNGQVTPLVAQTLGIKSADDLDAEIKRLNAMPRKEEIALTGPDGNLTPEAIETLQRDVRLDQLRKLRENMQPERDGQLTEQLVGKVAEDSEAQRAKVAVRAAADLTPEQRSVRAQTLAAQQQKLLDRIITQAQRISEAPSARSLIAKSDRKLAERRMLALRDAYMKAFHAQMAEERAMRQRPGVTEADLKETVRVKELLDELISRSTALPTSAVIDPLGVEKRYVQKRRVTNRPRQRARFLQEAAELQQEMRDNYLKLQRGTVTRTLPNGQQVEVRMSPGTRKQIEANDRKAAARIERLRRMFEGDPEFETVLTKRLGKAVSDPRPLAERPFGKIDDAVEALREQLAGERKNFVETEADSSELRNEAGRIREMLSRIDNRSTMRVGQQAGDRQDTRAATKERLQQRLAEIERQLLAFSKEEQESKRAPLKEGQRTLFGFDPEMRAGEGKSAPPTPQAQALALIDSLIGDPALDLVPRVAVPRTGPRETEVAGVPVKYLAKEGRPAEAASPKRKTSLTEQDTRMLEDARRILLSQEDSQDGTALARLIVAELGDSERSGTRDWLNPTNIINKKLRAIPVRKTKGAKRPGTVGQNANLSSALRSIGDMVAVAKDVNRDDRKQGMLFPETRSEVVTEKEGPYKFRRFVQSMAKKLAAERIRYKAMVDELIPLMAKAAAVRRDKNARLETELDLIRRAGDALAAEEGSAKSRKVGAQIKSLNTRTYNALLKNQQLLLSLNAEQSARSLLTLQQDSLRSLQVSKTEAQKALSDLVVSKADKAKIAEARAAVGQATAAIRAAKESLATIKAIPPMRENWADAYAAALAARKKIGSTHESKLSALNAALRAKYDDAPSTAQLEIRAKRLSDAVSVAESARESNQRAAAENEALIRREAIPGMRFVNEAIYDERGGKKQDDDFERKIRRVKTEIGGTTRTASDTDVKGQAGLGWKTPKKVVPASAEDLAAAKREVKPATPAERKAVFVTYKVFNNRGNEETRTIEVPVVPAVVKSGDNIGVIKVDKDKNVLYEPSVTVPAEIRELVRAQLNERAIKDAGSVDNALPVTKVAPTSARDRNAANRVAVGFPGAGGEAGVARQPPLNDLRTGTPALERRSGATKIVDSNDFRVGDAGGGIDAAQAKERVAAVKAKLPDGISFTYYESPSALPESVLADAKSRGIAADTIRGGVTADGKVFIVGDTHTDMLDLERTIAHELRGHYGFEGFVGEGGMGKLLAGAERGHENGVFGLADKLGVGEQARAAAQGVKLAGGDERAQKMQALKEIVAYTEEATVDKNLLGRAQQFIKEMVGAVRAALKRMGLVDASKLSTSDLFYLMRQSRKNFEASLPLAKIDSNGYVSFALGYAPKAKPAEGYEQLGGIVDKAVAENKTTYESLRGTAFDTLKLAARQKTVDARAGIEEAVTRALSGGVISDKTAGDVMYAVRTADHRSNWIAATVSEGAPQIVKDEKTGEWRIEIKPGASLKDMFAALNAAVGTGEGKMGNEQFVGSAFTAYMAAERDLNDLGGDKLLSISDTEKQQLVEMGRQNPTFQEARRIYKEYNQNLLKFVASTGALSEETVSGWLAKDYVPFYRERNGVVELLVGAEPPTRIGNLNEQPYLKALVGGDSKVKDVFTTALRNTSILMDMALRNTAARNTAFGFQEMGILAGAVNAETGKVRGIVKGQGTARKDAIRFKLDGVEHHAVIDTSMSEALFGDIPPELLAQSLEGIVVQLPDFMRMLGIPSQWVRTMVTRDPRYAFRQIIRDSLSSWVTSGGDTKPMVGTLRELTTMYNGKNATENFLKNSGVLGGQVLQGMNEDMAKIARMISAGGNNSRLNTLFAGLDALGVKADAATRVSLYNSYIRQGMSERQALLAVMDSTNFTKRGSSPFMYTLNTLIPFFNAQIVGLDVLYRAATGKASGAEKLRIKNKLRARGAMMAAMTMLYAAGMEDDEAYENATPQQRFANWFVRIPGVDEPLRVPIPFEVGLLFKALPEAISNAAGDDAKSAQAWGGLMDQVKQSVPGWSSMFLPQAIKPLIEIGFNKAAMNGIPIVGRKLEGLEKSEQFDERTPEILKWVGQYSSAVGLSPKQLEHLVGSYTTALGLALLRMPEAMMGGDGPAKPEQRLSEMPIVGPMFQPNDAGGILQLAFQQAEEAARAKQTFTTLVMRGDTAAAERFLTEYSNKMALASFGGRMQQAVGKINAMETVVRADPKLSPVQKRQQLAELRQLELMLARQATDLRRETERQGARP